ncbi:zinc finger and BTB domain-containing protein 24 [Periophthalmus magnuspinnatus]|uniref:zinc finger and BTB domain-containing protein 24 n=1 Tax=Periophthalmus magnuspinnatus TaxID=409849 RepID=UPI00145AFC41|nr:zinc finger and BTB domain-containing protein 24 [Periophthalmus magnuspinnatus]
MLPLHSENHKLNILKKLEQFRTKGLLCDVDIEVDHRLFKVHRTFLAASSEYFLQLFTSQSPTNHTTLKMDDMAADMFSFVIDFIYTGHISIEEKQTEQLLAAATRLEVKGLIEELTDVVSKSQNGKTKVTKVTTRKRGRPRKLQQNEMKRVPEERCEKERGDGKQSGERCKKERGDGERGGERCDDKRGHRERGGECCEDKRGNRERGGERCEDKRGDGERGGERCDDKRGDGERGGERCDDKRGDGEQGGERCDEERGDGERGGKRCDTKELQTKRQIKVPLKYKLFTLGQEETSKHQKVKRGRKRKYPNTEARCDQCDKVFKNHLFLTIHQRTHTGEKPFTCSVCGHSFTQKHSLIVHQRAHTGERPFVCSVCNKALCTKNSLQDHMKLHEDNKSFSCDKCDRTFTQKRQLKSHYRVHTDKSLPECAECHHKFLDTAQLKKHLRTHTGEKPFTCEICGKCFTTKSTLQTHIRIHRGEKPFECHLCQKSFSDPSARRRHVASHSGKKPFSCSSCNLSFTRLDNLKSHTKTHNKEPPSSTQDQGTDNILELQPFPPGAEEIQLVVSADNVNFVPGQDQSITLLTQNLPNLAVVAQSDQTLDQSEQMHVITLSKEAMEQLQVLPSVPSLTPGAEEPGQTIHINSQSAQAISISQTTQQLTANHIQGQTFQIQAGTVSYLYTTGLPQDS